MNQLKEQTFLVSGGSSGVGKATAIGLAQKGAKIIIVSRDVEASAKTLEEIAQRTGNEKGEYLIADLSLQSSVKKLAEEFKRKYDNLHVLANCAGAIFSEKQMTAEGTERTFAVNYMSHYWLTSNLLDILQESRMSRIITVTGNPAFLKNAKLNFEDLQSVKKFSGLTATSNAMFARLFFTFELAKRLEGTQVTANAFNPGVIKSKLLSGSAWYLKLLGLLYKPFEKSICDVSTWLSTSDDLKNISGKFFDKDRKIIPFDERFDPKIGERLWTMSEEISGNQKLRSLPSKEISN